MVGTQGKAVGLVAPVNTVIASVLCAHCTTRKELCKALLSSFRKARCRVTAVNPDRSYGRCMCCGHDTNWGSYIVACHRWSPCCERNSEEMTCVGVRFLFSLVGGSHRHEKRNIIKLMLIELVVKSANVMMESYLNSTRIKNYLQMRRQKHMTPASSFRQYPPSYSLLHLP